MRCREWLRTVTATQRCPVAIGPRMPETMSMSTSGLLGRLKNYSGLATVWHKFARGSRCLFGSGRNSVRTFRHLVPVLLLGAILASTDAQAEPTGGKVVYGSADIVRSSPKQSDIIQRTDKAIIDWNTFSIAADERVRFQQADLPVNRAQPCQKPRCFLHSRATYRERAGYAHQSQRHPVRQRCQGRRWRPGRDHDQYR